MALGVKPEARSAQRQPVTGRTGKQADCQACSRLAGQVQDRPPTEACCRLAFEPAMRTGSNAGMRPVTYADMQACKPSSGPRGRRPRSPGGRRPTKTPRRGILVEEILKKQKGLRAGRTTCGASHLTFMQPYALTAHRAPVRLATPLQRLRSLLGYVRCIAFRSVM